MQSVQIEESRGTEVRLNPCGQLNCGPASSFTFLPLFMSRPASGGKSGESGLSKREEMRGFLMLWIEPFARFPVQPVRGCRSGSFRIYKFIYSPTSPRLQIRLQFRQRRSTNIAAVTQEEEIFRLHSKCVLPFGN